VEAVEVEDAEQVASNLACVDPEVTRPVFELDACPRGRRGKRSDGRR
jgi:hypothetical protein